MFSVLGNVCLFVAIIGIGWMLFKGAAEGDYCASLDSYECEPVDDVAMRHSA